MWFRNRRNPASHPGQARRTDLEPKRVSDAERTPDYRALEFRPRTSRWCLLVFAIDEGERIRRQIQQLVEYADVVDVVIADGGSTDGSLIEVELASAKVTALLTKLGAGRLSAQMRMAFHWAIAQGYDGVIVMDGNSKDDPTAIPRFVKALEEGYDHTQGSRYIAGGHGVNTPRLRHYGVKLVHAPLISIAARRRHTDTTNGFRAYSMKLLRDSRVQPLRNIFMNYELHYYLAIRASRLGFKMTEVPVTRSYPSGQAAPTKIRGMRGNLGILRTLVRAALHRYDP